MAKAAHCPLCGQYMDYCAIMYRNHKFIDGCNYHALCFGCAAVPKDTIQIYDKDGTVAEEKGPFFSYKYLNSPEELVDIGACKTLQEAGKCVRAVKRQLKSIGGEKLKKLNLTRPKADYEIR
jgi:hypothetical protein